jgi:hypothetical protein
VRYLSEAYTAVAHLDYDALFNSLNLARLLGNWRVSDRLHLDLLAEYRNSPFLTSTNALIGSGFDSLEDLPDTLSDSEIRDLAREHTARVTTVSLGGMFRFNERYYVTGNFSASDYSGTEAYDYDDASGFDFSYRAQVVGNGLLLDGDVNTLGFRVLDAEATNVYSIFVDSRYTLYRKLRLNPRLRIDYRGGGSLSDQWSIRPAIRLDYRWNALTFDLEFSYEWNRASTGLIDGDQQVYLLNLGARYDF